MWTELEREQEKKIKSLHGCGWCLPCPFPTQTFEEVSSRGWENGQPPQLSLHWYHCRNFSQYREKKNRVLQTHSGCSPICASSITQRHKFTWTQDLWPLEYQGPQLEIKGSLWGVGSACCGKDYSITNLWLQFEKEQHTSEQKPAFRVQSNLFLQGQLNTQNIAVMLLVSFTEPAEAHSEHKHPL